MGNHLVNRTVCALVVALAVAAAPAQSGVGVLTDLNTRVYCSDSEGSPHPKRVDALQTITDPALVVFGQATVFAGYGVQTAPDRARVKGLTVDAVLVKADGSVRPLGRLRAKVDGNGQAEAARRIAETLERGDLIEWRFQFKGAPKLREGECFLVAFGYSDLPPQEAEAALSGALRLGS